MFSVAFVVFALQDVASDGQPVFVLPPGQLGGVLHAGTCQKLHVDRGTGTYWVYDTVTEESKQAPAPPSGEATPIERALASFQHLRAAIRWIVALEFASRPYEHSKGVDVSESSKLLGCRAWWHCFVCMSAHLILNTVLQVEGSVVVGSRPWLLPSICWLS